MVNVHGHLVANARCTATRLSRSALADGNGERRLRDRATLVTLHHRDARVLPVIDALTAGIIEPIGVCLGVDGGLHLRNLAGSKYPSTIVFPSTFDNFASPI